jgi:hypothetical protein
LLIGSPERGGRQAASQTEDLLDVLTSLFLVFQRKGSSALEVPLYFDGGGS